MNGPGLMWSRVGEGPTLALKYGPGERSSSKGLILMLLMLRQGKAGYM